METASAEAIYCSHTIEHVPTAAVANLLQESFRVLKPGAMLRIVCPDAALFVQTLRLQNVSYWRWRRRFFASEKADCSDVNQVRLEDFVVREVATRRCRFVKGCVDPLEPEEVQRRFLGLDEAAFLDSLTEGLQFDPSRPDHITWWSEAKLMRALRDAGFQNCYVSRQGQSMSPPMTNLNLFDRTQPRASLYVEAIR